MNNFSIIHHGNTLPQSIRDIVTEWHYSHSYRSQKQVHVFGLRDGATTIGAAIFGQPMSRNSDQSILELRRFCLIDNTPKNTESFFLGGCLRWLRKHTDITQVLTFADPNQGHQGTIYKATNFKYDGLESNGNPRIIKMDDRTIHLRQAYQKKGGEYTNDAQLIQEAIREGRAEVIKQERKLRYLYDLRR